MPISTLPGVRLASVANAIQDILNATSPARVGTKFDVFAGYLRWATGAGVTLGVLVPAREVEALVLTPRYWNLLSIDPASNDALQAVVNAAFEDTERRLATAKSDLELAQERWSSLVGAVLVPDTNVLLEHKEEMPNIPWCDIANQVAPGQPVNVVLPMLVVDELDKAKSDRARARARRSLQEINRLFEAPHEPAETRDAHGRQVTFHLLLDDPLHARLDDADMEIADQAKTLTKMIGSPSTIVTFDTGMALRGRAQGLGVIHLGRSGGR